MAKATTRALSLTTLVIGKVEVPIALFTTVAKPGKLSEFATAGPNGGVLKAQSVARAVPVAEARDETPDVPVHSSDPLADDGADGIREAMNREENAPDAQSAARETLAADGDALTAVGRDVKPAGPFEGWAEQPKAMIAAVDGEYGRELVEEGTGVVVLPQDVRRGVRLEDGSFIDCTDQLADIDEKTRLERMEVVSFVDVTQIPRARVSGAYYIGADHEHAPRALRMLFEGLKVTRRGAVVKLTKRSRQSLGVIAPFGGCLLLYELVWAENFREAPGRAKSIQKASVSEQEVRAVCELIGAMSAKVGSLDELRDDAIALREDLQIAAFAGNVAPIVRAPKPDAADDLMAQLAASLEARS